MSVTKKQIKELYPDALDIKQYGAKQLFKITYPNHKLLLSYKTVIGVKETGELWRFTNEKFSVTTTRQLNYFINSYWIGGACYKLSPDEFKEYRYNIINKYR